MMIYPTLQTSDCQLRVSYLKILLLLKRIVDVIVSVNDCVLMVPLESYPMNMNHEHYILNWNDEMIRIMQTNAALLLYT